MPLDAIDREVGPAEPRVSVVIPAFKSAGCIAAAVASVAAQTIPDWEVVVVDDCSPDDIAGALSAYEGDPRIRVVRHEVNGGAFAARNTGISLAGGRFVAFLDADDTWMPGKLESQLAAVLGRPDPDKVFCVTRTIVNLADGRHIVRPVRGKRPDERMDEFIWVSAGFCQTSSFFLSRDLALKIPFRKFTVSEDHMFAIDACGQGAEYILVEEPLAVWNNDIREGRLSNTSSLSRGRAFMAEVQDLVSPKALLGFESRYLGAFLLRENPLQGLALIAKALAAGALRPRFAASLLVRAVVPAEGYHRVRAKILGRT